MKIKNEIDPKMRRAANALKHGKYAKKFRVLFCDHCYAMERCPHYRGGQFCALNKRFMKLKIGRNPEGIRKKLIEVLNQLGERLMRATHFEILDGGFPDEAVNRMQANYFKFSYMLWQMEHPLQVNVQQTNTHNLQRIQFVKMIQKKFSEGKTTDDMLKELALKIKEKKKKELGERGYT